MRAKSPPPHFFNQKKVRGGRGRLMMKSTVGIKWKQNEANVKCKPIFLCEKQTRNCRKSTISRKFYQFFFVRFFYSRQKMTIYHSKSIFRTRYMGLFLCKNNQHILSQVKNLSGFFWSKFKNSNNSRF